MPDTIPGIQGQPLEENEHSSCPDYPVSCADITLRRHPGGRRDRCKGCHGVSQHIFHARPPFPPSGGFCFWCYVKANVSSGPDHNFLYHFAYYFRWNIFLPDPFTIDFQIAYNRGLSRDSHLLV